METLLPTYLLETVPVLLIWRELGEQLQILEVVEALEHRAQQQLNTHNGETFSVPDPDPDSHVFGRPGSGSICQRYGSGSLYHQAKKVRNTLIPTVL
jgi:hypothetical protein